MEPRDPGEVKGCEADGERVVVEDDVGRACSWLAEGGGAPRH